jgi:hypothetical protein
VGLWDSPARISYQKLLPKAIGQKSGVAEWRDLRFYRDAFSAFYLKGTGFSPYEISRKDGGFSR